MVVQMRSHQRMPAWPTRALRDPSINDYRSDLTFRSVVVGFDGRSVKTTKVVSCGNTLNRLASVLASL